MKPQTNIARSAVLDPRSMISFTRRLLFLAAIAVLSPIAALGAITPTTAGPNWGIDDSNTSNLNPSPMIAVSGLINSQCPWINTALDAFDVANSNDTVTWSYTWAPQDQMAKVEAGISVLDYYAWVVSAPTFTDADGNTYGVPTTLQNSNDNVNDVGGAVINLKYTPQAGAPAISNLHWIQALYAYYDDYGAYVPGNFQTRLDNPFAHGTPFYDDGGAAGTLAGGGGFFADRPWKIGDRSPGDESRGRRAISSGDRRSHDNDRRTWCHKQCDYPLWWRVVGLPIRGVRCAGTDRYHRLGAARRRWYRDRLAAAENRLAQSRSGKSKPASIPRRAYLCASPSDFTRRGATCSVWPASLSAKACDHCAASLRITPNAENAASEPAT